jgi:hypothetical protein
MADYQTVCGGVFFAPKDGYIILITKNTKGIRSAERFMTQLANFPQLRCVYITISVVLNTIDLREKVSILSEDS